CDPDIACPGDTCILEGTYVKVKVPKSRIAGLVQRLRKEKPEVQPRLGALFYSSSICKKKVYIGDYPVTGQSKGNAGNADPGNADHGNADPGNADPDHPYTYFVRYINFISPDGGTATAPAMWEAYDYFKQANDHDYEGGNGFQHRNTYGHEHGHTYRWRWCKHNCTDEYMDPLYVCDAQKHNCQFVPCAKNFVILVSDGQWNRGGDPINGTCTIDTGYEYDSADPVVPAYKMHTETLRVEDGVNVHVDKVYTLGVFLGGTGEQSLKNVAMYGAFNFNNSTQIWPANLSGYPTNTCYMDDCSYWFGYGKGSACTPLPPSSPDWDSNGDGVPDTFFNGKTASEIKDSIIGFVEDILKKASGTSATVLAERQKDSSSIRKQGTIIAQAIFYPQKQFKDSHQTIDWVGNIFSYWFLNTKKGIQNIREDTDENKILNISKDNIIEFEINNQTGALTVNVFNSTQNGTAGNLIATYTDLEDIKNLFSVGDKLKEMNATDRNIYGVDIDNKMVKFIVENKDKFSDLFYKNENDVEECLKNGNIAENIIKYTRGEDIAGCRSRNTGDGTWKLGDIVSSSPVMVNYGDYTIMFVGANDGMLHAFKVGKLRADDLTKGTIVKICEDSQPDCKTSTLGKELWAFIPKNVMPYLRYLASPDYGKCHIYSVDLSPYFVDLGDKKILIGGMRLGGACSDTIVPPEDTCPNPNNDNNCIGRSSYFALDITDPTHPEFLWEFTNSDLGFTYSGPGVIKAVDGNYYVVFGSGPTSYSAQFDNNSNNSLKIFILDLFTGTLKRTIDTNITKAFSGKIFSSGYDFNNNGYTDFLIFGYTRQDGANTNYKGGLIFLAGDGSSTSQLYPLDSTKDPSRWKAINITQLGTDIPPVTATTVVGNCFNRKYLYLGTGRWFRKDDDWEVNQNLLFGIPLQPDTITANKWDYSNYNYITIKTNTADVTEVSNVENVCLDNTQRGIRGWYLKLDPANDLYLKEKAISNPTVTDKNVVIFPTIFPSNDPCKFGGQTRIWALNCATGAPIDDDSCPNFKIREDDLNYFIQLSGGDIRHVNRRSFTEKNGRATPKLSGIAPEGGGFYMPPSTGSTGEILLWLEK
ncbi:MAG: PilC/PilY family type IV pilus protein, partial [Desulfonauticus sp.]|nr:PilC/PilY family type IV pilus protein [Desulfonauticus sp.]